MIFYLLLEIHFEIQLNIIKCTNKELFNSELFDRLKRLLFNFFSSLLCKIFPLLFFYQVPEWDAFKEKLCMSSARGHCTRNWWKIINKKKSIILFLSLSLSLSLSLYFSFFYTLISFPFQEIINFFFLK